MARIALVDDTPDTALLIRAVMPEHELLSFDTALAALAALPEAGADLVLLDISLPDMDGETVLAKLRAEERTSALPIVAFTGHCGADDRQHYLKSGFDGFVAKPLMDFDELRHTVARLLA